MMAGKTADESRDGVKLTCAGKPPSGEGVMNVEQERECEGDYGPCSEVRSGQEGWCSNAGHGPCPRS